MKLQPDYDALNYAHGEPVLRGVFKQQADDFLVEEELGFRPDGEGEHEFLYVEKIGLTTAQLQLELAKAFRLPVQKVSYAGLKDKLGITRQWFSIHSGLKSPAVELNELPVGVRVLERLRNQRKLQRGSHRGNRFHVSLRSCVALADQWQQRVHDIAAIGVPNYFGPQRFGRNNLEQVCAWFADESRAPRARNQRSMLLSSARSFIFNAVLSDRVGQQSWNRALPGEEWALSGSTRTFADSQADAVTLEQRLREFDIHPTGPLWGEGGNKTADVVAALETSVIARYPELTQGLQRHGLLQERRPLRLQVLDLQSELNGDVLTLRFRLGRGSYATAVLRELVNTEMS